MNFSKEIAAALPHIQALAESNMGELVEVSRPDGRVTLPDGTVETLTEIVWSGSARITQQVSSGFYEPHPKVAGHMLTTDIVTVKMPVTAVCAANDTITVTASEAQGTRGERFRATAIKKQSQASSLRVMAEEIIAGR